MVLLHEEEEEKERKGAEGAVIGTPKGKSHR